MTRTIRYFAALMLAFAAAAHAAVVEIATNGVVIGELPTETSSSPSEIVSDVFSQTFFRTNVFLHDETNMPLHLRLPAGNTNNIQALADLVYEGLDEHLSDTYLTPEGASNAFIPKWPQLYKIGTYAGDTNYPPPANSEGLFRSSGPFVYLQTSNNSLNVGTIGDGVPFFYPAPSLNLYSDKGLVSVSGSNISVKAKSQNGGLVFTNSADGVFPITWNGVSKTGWDDIGGRVDTNAIIAVASNSFISKWPHEYEFEGTTNLLAVVGDRLFFGGRPVGTGLEAGHGITISENTNTLNEIVGVKRNIDFDNVTVFGDLTVAGTEYHNTVIRHTTNVYVGVQTNYITTDIYTTNNQYQYLHVVTRTTNYVDQVINVGGDQDYSLALSVLSPSYRIDNSDTNHPVLTGVGMWDLGGCDIDFGAHLSSFVSTGAVASVNGWTGSVEFTPGSNIVFETNLVSKSIAVNAVIDLSGYATKDQLSDYAPNTAFVGVSNRVNSIESDYITSGELAAELENYAPASEITVITTNIEEIVSALSNPVIQTPDHKKWTIQGRYANGQVTHVWVPYIGVYSSPIRISMTDGRVFEMVGRYSDGNTNIITHIWQEVQE